MIAWFARNSVAVTFLLLAIVAWGGYATLNTIPLEVFPESELSRVNITVVNRAATPEDIELSITNRLEEAVADLHFVDELSSRSTEATSRVTVKLLRGTNRQKALNEVKARVDALSTLPQSAERPVVEIPLRKPRVLKLVMYGNLDEAELAIMARTVRDNLMRRDGISLVEIEGVRPYEIAIEVDQNTLRAYNLTLNGIARSIRQQAVDISAGQLKTQRGDILLRSKEQAYVFNDYQQVVVKRFADGSVLHLGDIAQVIDGFDENPLIANFNGRPAANLNVFRIGNESVISVAEAVRQHLQEYADIYPDTVQFAIWDDDSQLVQERLDTLLGGAWQGALLIIILLTLFLHPSVAFWVTLGIPVCFAGALALFPVLGLSLNMITLFAFILVLGVVVDDAIVTGENIYAHNARGVEPLAAAIKGTHEIALPVFFGVVTTMLAFVPMLLVPREVAAMGTSIAGVVIPVLMFSLIESKFILPNHLSRMRLQHTAKTGAALYLMQVQRSIASGLEQLIQRVYQPLAEVALRWRYITVVVFISLFTVCLSLFNNGFIKQSFFPKITGDSAIANVTFPVGTPFSVTDAAVQKMQSELLAMQQQYKVDGKPVITAILAVSGASVLNRGNDFRSGVSHLGGVSFEIDTELQEQGGYDIKAMVKEWRQRVGTIIGIEKINYSANLFDGGSAVYIQVRGNNFNELKQVIGKVRRKLTDYNGVFDIEDSLSSGKQELQIKLKPQAELLGLDVQTLGQQVRHAFYGAEAQRIQRGRDDIRVIVRYPKNQRDSLASLENMLVTTATGGEARFSDIATVEWGHSPSSIYHYNRYRVASIQADVDPTKINSVHLNQELAAFMQRILRDHPTVEFVFEGEERSRAEFLAGFQLSLGGVLLAIFGLLAVAFKSYYQPFIIMFVIPFAMIGAWLGHFLLGQSWTMFSYMGAMALVGVVINDGLVLVDWINKRVQQGQGLISVILNAGRARFRPVLLTSITTFAGLLPILFLNSVQAGFLKPMAISLAFGILFATLVTLLLVPCNYLILEDIRRAKRWLFNQPAETENNRVQV